MQCLCGMRKYPHRAWVCAQEGLSDELECLLRSRVYPNTAWSGRALMWVAAANNHVACVEAVARAGGDANKPNPPTKYTPLHCAAEGGHVASVDALLRIRANVHARCSLGCTALLLAARRDHVHVVTQLAAAKANVNAETKGYTTPLYHAAAEASVACVQELLQLGADVGVIEYTDVSPLRAVCNRYDVDQGSVLDIATLLLYARAGVHSAHRSIPSPLHDAVRLGISDLIGLLTSFKADVHSRHYGATPMANAVSHKQLRSVLSLVQNKVDVNFSNRDLDLHTALHPCVMLHEALFATPVNCSAGASNINMNVIAMPDASSGRLFAAPALCQAAELRHASIVDALLVAGANVEHYVERDVGVNVEHYVKRDVGRSADVVNLCTAQCAAVHSESTTVVRVMPAHREDASVLHN